MRLLAWVNVVLAVAMVGCGGNGKPNDGGVVAPPNQVKGDLVTRFVLPDGGVLLAPTDLSASTVFAYYDGPDGGLVELQAPGTVDGRFALVVPADRYTLNLGNLYVNTTQRSVHFGQNVAGRPDVFQANPGEGLGLSASNVEAWVSDDEVQLVSWGAGINYFSSAQGNKVLVLNPPDAGDTSFTNLGINLEGSPVIDADAGDDLFITQLASTSFDGGSWKRVTRAASPHGVTLAISKLTAVSVAFSVVPQVPFDIAFDTASFEGTKAQVHPEAQLFESTLLVDAHLGPFGPNTLADGAPDLGILKLNPGQGQVHLGLSYGNPFPAAYTPFVSAGARFEVLYRAPFPDGGLASPRSEVGTVSRVLSMAEATGGSIAATITPVTDVKVDGVSVDSSYPTVSRTPLVSWTLPTTGTVSRIDVQPIQLKPDVATTRRSSGPVLRVVGAATQVRLPPDFVQPGQLHYLRITAVMQPAAWDPTTPLREAGPPAAAATAMTRAFMVAPLP